MDEHVKDHGAAEGLFALSPNVVDGLMPGLHSVGREQIQRAAHNFVLSATDADVTEADLFVWLRQVEEAVAVAKEMLTAKPFDSIGTRFGGQQSGTVLGHKVEISYRSEWVYDEKTLDAVDKHKAKIKDLQKDAQAKGLADKEPGKSSMARTGESLRWKPN